MHEDFEGESNLTPREGLVLQVLQILVEDPVLEHHTPAHIARVTGLSEDDVLGILDELVRREFVANVSAEERARAQQN